MATKLKKDVVRESEVKFDDREVMVTLTADQEVKMKLKGLRSGEVSISIDELYRQVAGVEEDSSPSEETPKKSSGGGSSITYTHKGKTKKSMNPMISLHDLRSSNAVSSLDYQDRVKFEKIIVDLIERYPEKYG